MRRKGCHWQHSRRDVHRTSSSMQQQPAEITVISLFPVQQRDIGVYVSKALTTSMCQLPSIPWPSCPGAHVLLLAVHVRDASVSMSYAIL